MSELSIRFEDFCDWMEAFQRSEATCHNLFEEIASTVGRRRCITRYNADGSSTRRNQFRPIPAGSFSIALSETVAYGRHLSVAHPEGPGVLPSKVQSRIRVYKDDQMIDEVVRPPRLLTVDVAGMPVNVIADPLSLLEGNIIQHQAEQRRFCTYLEQAAQAQALDI